MHYKVIHLCFTLIYIQFGDSCKCHQILIKFILSKKKTWMYRIKINHHWFDFQAVRQHILSTFYKTTLQEKKNQTNPHPKIKKQQRTETGWRGGKKGGCFWTCGSWED